MWAVNWAGAKKVIEVELLFYHLKRTIIFKSWRSRKNNFCGFIFESVYIFKDLSLFTIKYLLDY